MRTALEKSLRPLARRLRGQRALRFFSFGLAGGAACALLLIAASFFWPLEHAAFYGLGLLLACAALGALAGGLWPVSAMQAARSADGLGLMARAQTALEWEKEPETPMLTLQKADFLGALADFSLNTIPLRPQKAAMLTAVCAAVMAGCLLLLPNPQTSVLRARETFRQEMKKQAEHLEAGAKELDQKNEEAALKARQLLGELAAEMRTSDAPREALEAIDQTARKLEKLRQNQGEALRQALSQNGLSALADAMEQEDEEAIRKEMEKLTQEELAKALTQAAQNAGDAAQALENAAAAAQAGNLSRAAQALLNAGATASASASQAGALLQMAQLATATAGQAMGASSSGNTPLALAALGAQSQAGSGAGQGMGGAGAGQGGGAGAGQGSTNLDAGYTSEQGRSSGGSGRAPEEKIGEYEAIYDPTRIGAEGNLTQERGRIGEGETTELTIGGGAGSLGGSVPYNEVAGEYQQSAVESVQNMGLPSYVQKWVETYFQSLLD